MSSVLARLLQHRLYVKVEVSIPCLVSFLEYVITSEGVCMDDQNLHTVLE